MKENAQILLRMMNEFHRQVQDSLGGKGKPALLLGNPVVRTFNAYLEQMREMFPDSFIAQMQSVEPVPELGETELGPAELEKLHISKAHEVSMACSQIIEYLSGMLNGEVGVAKTTRRLPEILAVLDNLLQEVKQFQLADSEEDKRVTEMLVGKYNDCLSVCCDAAGENDVILPRLFKPIEFAGDEFSSSAKIHEVRISASGLHAYLETLEQQEAALKKQQHASIHEFKLEDAQVRDWMKTKDRDIHSEFGNVRQQAEDTKEQVFEKIENVEVQFEDRIQQFEERLDGINENIDELKDRFNEKTDERVDEFNERIGNLEEELNNRIGELEEKHDGELENIQEELRGEIEGLEEKIGELEEHTEEIGEFERRLEEMSRNTEKFEDKLSHSDDRYSERIDRLDERMDERIDKIDERFDELNERIDELAENINEKTEELSEEREESTNGLEERIQELREEIEGKIEELQEKIDD